jgi:phosphatidylserine/phosphatidylglycerophosphate/cardiolipin synthase-like enzyme
MKFDVRVVRVLAVLLAGSLTSTVPADTQVYFTQGTDRRFAWLGNDAHGNEDFVAHVISLINSASTSIDASTMSFSSTQIGQALANRAKAGVPVRVVMNGKHRFQPGVMQLLKATGAQVIDDNFPALVTRVNFQQAAGTPVPGWLVDSGAAFGPKPGGFSYGWAADSSAFMQATPDPTYESTLLGHCYARANSAGPNNWELEVPNGFYYVHLVVGQPTFNPRNVITVEGLPVMQTGSGFADLFATRGNSPGVDPDGAGPIPAPPAGVDAEEDDFRSATVSGGLEAQRIQVTDGRLTVTVGRASESSFSSLCYIEVYRGDTNAEGNPGTIENRVQKFGITHSKFLIIDGSRVWISSANLTNGAAGRSEDAIETTDAGVIAAFQTEFNMQWGAASGTPDVASSHFQRFKTNGMVTASVPGVSMPGPFSWELFFSPSRTSVGLDIADRISTLINGSTRELILCLEQFTDSGPANGFDTSAFLMNQVENRINAGHRVWGVFGNTDGSDPVFSIDNGHPNAFISQQSAEEDGIGLHDKFLLVDALHDSRYAGRGKLLAGSMNWSQAGMASNDEQTAVIHDPAIANQFLQRAMKALLDEGLTYDRRADIVLVLDRSGSMNLASATPGVSKLEASKLAAQAFLSVIETDAGHRVALVRFGSDFEPFGPPDSELSPYVAGSQAALMSLITGTNATGPLADSTCYGCALNHVHSRLDLATEPRPRRLVHFFTDGLENETPMADGIYQTLIADFGAEIHSTAFGPFSPYAPGGTAAILGTMATASGGTFAQLDDLSTGALQKRFIEVARDATDLDALVDPDFDLVAGKPVTTKVAVDASATRLQFLAYWGKPQPGLVTLTIKTPWGQLLTETTPGVRVVESDGSVDWHVDVRKIAKAAGKRSSGVYTVRLALDKEKTREKRSTAGFAVLGDTGIDLQGEVLVRKPGQSEVVILARLLKQGTPVVNGTITALWTPPAFERDRPPKPVTLRLLDDGKHEDGMAGDGLFGTALDLEGAGSHTFHLVAQAKGNLKKDGVARIRREMHISTTVDLRSPYKGELPREPKDTKTTYPSIR